LKSPASAGLFHARHLRVAFAQKRGADHVQKS
jgi:hypothetical protein